MEKTNHLHTYVRPELVRLDNIRDITFHDQDWSCSLFGGGFDSHDREHEHEGRH